MVAVSSSRASRSSFHVLVLSEGMSSSRALSRERVCQCCWLWVGQVRRRAGGWRASACAFTRRSVCARLRSSTGICSLSREEGKNLGWRRGRLKCSGLALAKQSSFLSFFLEGRKDISSFFFLAFFRFLPCEGLEAREHSAGQSGLREADRLWMCQENAGPRVHPRRHAALHGSGSYSR